MSGLELRDLGKVAAAAAVFTEKDQLLLQNTAAAAAASDTVTAAAAAATAAAAAPLFAEMHVIDGTPVHTFVKATYSIEVRCWGKVVWQCKQHGLAYICLHFCPCHTHSGPHLRVYACLPFHPTLPW